jgi:GNAT superfamily N-acetyltransferase
VWEDDRAHLAAHPDAIAPPREAIADGRVRVAVDSDGRLVGFSIILRTGSESWELDDLFVEPELRGTGIGRFLVEDVVARAATAGVTCLDVIANRQAVGFYERVGFEITGEASTRFATAPRMSRRL